MYENSEGESEGDCRRYAPRPVSAPRKHEDFYYDAVWPVTWASHWCGEYLRKNV